MDFKKFKKEQGKKDARAKASREAIRRFCDVLVGGEGVRAVYRRERGKH
jgi:hypothetical protein